MTAEKVDISPDEKPEVSRSSEQELEAESHNVPSEASHFNPDPEPKSSFYWGGNHPDVPKMNKDLFDGYAKLDQPDKYEGETKE